VGAVLVALTVPLSATPDPNFYERTYATQEKALIRSFRKATSFVTRNISLTEAQHSQAEAILGWKLKNTNYEFITAKKNKETLGYALNEIGKHYPITFLVAITPTNEIKKVTVLIYRERIGNKVRKRRFLKQFLGKSLDDSIAINQDIHGITGATLSSWAIAAGARKALAIANVLVHLEQ